MHVRIVSEPYGECRLKTTWICERCCRPYHGRECTHCYCKIFPPYYKPFSKPYPISGTFEEHKEWDSWHIQYYMMEPIEDPELVYEIGSEELIYRIHQKESYSKMIKQPKRSFAFKTSWRYCWKDCPTFVYTQV